jgi:hypothetical protein
MAQHTPSTSSSNPLDRSMALYERVPMAIGDEQTFATVRTAVESSFAASNVATFLKSVQRAALRIRDFEAVLQAGKMGTQTAALYAKLTSGDQGQIREFYLASLEQIDLALRNKFFKLYAYY